MPQYLSPGVYVEEVPSAVQAIAGVGTSTAGFIGKMADLIVVPPGPLYRVSGETVDSTKLQLATYPAQTREKTFTVKVEGAAQNNATLSNDHTQHITKIAGLSSSAGSVTIDYETFAIPVRGEIIGVGKKKKDDTLEATFRLATYPVQTQGPFIIQVNGTAVAQEDVTLENDFSRRTSRVKFASGKEPTENVTITGDYFGVPPSLVVYKEKLGVGDDKKSAFDLASSMIYSDPNLFQIRVGNDYDNAAPQPVNAFHIEPADSDGSKPKIVFTNAPAANQDVWADYVVYPLFQPVKVAKTVDDVKLCTSFSDFKKHFGDFSTDPDQQKLAHAVFGFFQNGGTRCYVARVGNDLTPALDAFKAIDEIAIVAAPGMADANTYDKIAAHCKIDTQDRIAILDSVEQTPADELTKAKINPPPVSDYAAFYFPWLQVFDPAEKTMYPNSEGRIFVPPSGHMAGIYARVDANRGVHKAPANEPVMGALGLRYKLSKAQQDGLNPHGVNCIRELNGAIRVWGARTIGGDANGEWRYINVRRLFLYLRESIDEGTQWVVFEPNDKNLWAKITRNITAFLTNVWRAGALFGNTPQEAFYVKCDEETNPSELRELGQVVTEIGVAVTKPAEFVIFRVSQWQPSK